MNVAIGVVAAMLVLAALACTVTMTRARPRCDWRPYSNDELLKLFYRRYARHLVESGEGRASMSEDVLQLQLIELRRLAHLAMLEQEKPVRLVSTWRAHRSTPVLKVVRTSNQAHRESDAAANRLVTGSRGIAPRTVRGSGKTV